MLSINLFIGNLVPENTIGNAMNNTIMTSYTILYFNNCIKLMHV